MKIFIRILQGINKSTDIEITPVFLKSDQISQFNREPDTCPV